jgi:hypothetical protein
LKVFFSSAFFFILIISVLNFLCISYFYSYRNFKILGYISSIDSLKFLSIYSISSYLICLSYFILFDSVSPFRFDFLNNSSEPGNTSEVILILNWAYNSSIFFLYSYSLFIYLSYLLSISFFILLFVSKTFWCLFCISQNHL